MVRLFFAIPLVQTFSVLNMGDNLWHHSVTHIVDSK